MKAFGTLWPWYFIMLSPSLTYWEMEVISVYISHIAMIRNALWVAAELYAMLSTTAPSLERRVLSSTTRMIRLSAMRVASLVI